MIHETIPWRLLSRYRWRRTRIFPLADPQKPHNFQQLIRSFYSHQFVWKGEEFVEIVSLRSMKEVLRCWGVNTRRTENTESELFWILTVLTVHCLPKKMIVNHKVMSEEKFYQIQRWGANDKQLTKSWTEDALISPYFGMLGCQRRSKDKRRRFYSRCNDIQLRDQKFFGW